MMDLLPANTKRELAESQLQAPLLFAPLEDEYLTITGDPNEAAVQDLVRNLVMRALTSLKPGRTQVCVIDPPGLGRDFGWLMHLGDFDPQLVSHRVWTQTNHIAKQVALLAMAAEDFIQQSLRNQYRNIVAYNQDAGALAEPFRLLVWSSMPSGLDDQSWKNLQSVLDTGARCGIVPILVIDPKLSWPKPEMQERVYRRGMHLTWDPEHKRFTPGSEAIRPLSLQTSPAVAPEQAQQIITEIGRRALLANRVEVPLESMVPAPGEQWLGDSSQCLEIPIGQSGVGRVHALKLGIGTAQHAIIAGKTGSGKSSLLHALITSAALKYSPDRLRLVLLDFKKGVEFQVYSDSHLPHADIIGIESHRDFGLSALEFVDSCMQRRGESFRQGGVQDIASWNALHPDQPMPRMLVVIDEFQELFVEDDKLSGQASLILDRIVRQGRSFGVHAVLSSQTLAGSYSLPRTTLGQMAVRIALQCDPSDAQIIFTEDNPAAARLKHPGQAVYNDAGGRIEGNQPMQIGWLDKKTQQDWLAQLPAGYQNQDPSTNRLGRCVIYDGNRAASWSSHNADLAIERATKEINPDATWCVAGESVAISPAVTFPLTRQAGRNMLVVGGEDAQAATVLHAITSSFVKATAARHGQVFAIQAAKPTDAHVLRLPDAWRQLGCELTVTDIRGADAMLKSVHALLTQRIEDDESSEVPAPVLLTLLQLGRLRTLRRDDDFGMGSFGESELSPDKMLEEILRDGPSQGVHVIVWAESFSTVNRWLSRAALREAEIRILMQMSANDSTNLIDTIAASRLGEHVMLVYDEATGQEQKFRPFTVESLAPITSWARG
jgi:S-DNA-T family DNA segregation ATPase FtsK/SpoIIIE